MVAGEPNDVQLKHVNGRWVVRVVENGRVSRCSFNAQDAAEGYAESQRIRLGLPGKPPVWAENPAHEHPKSLREMGDFTIADVLDLAEYSDRGIVTTLVDPYGVRLRLHLTVVTSELLCERIATALERRYGA
ncbi:hypothetical protein EN745_00540 [Mesorhizobium sp. M4A.F.Ca.ET.022.05.2.1]|uniref:hypothetical protein n=1 Tax=Mesorhizobium sp. M4A.F.Ca.ET.022.05.2.1 TaxID=2496653 RepID=UPI000FCC917B|nr:hypothetical protein [Mesorhizobium sp. M4A.F.Ca.ET.022.05.2.1]RVC83926.1 hypothetical protein EN745_00540 [Mesorhizobium sp. M4A.F.Ca.ET.022.05.2.1]